MVSGFGRLPPSRNSARGGFLTPIRSPAAPEPPTSSGASRKIGGKTACGSMRPGPTALRYLCGRNGCHPPGRHSRVGAESRDTPPAFRCQCRFPGVPPEPPGGTRGTARNPGTFRLHSAANADPPACRLKPRTARPKPALWEASHPRNRRQPVPHRRQPLP